MTEGGLYLLVAPNGGRYWRFNYRFAGKQKTLAVGVYPDAGLAKARERHLAARQLLANGDDPGRERRTAGKTFEEVAREWHTHWKGNRHERHAHYALKRLEADVFPDIGGLPLSEIPPRRFGMLCEKSSSGAPRILQSESCKPAVRSCVTQWPMTS